MNTLLLSLFLLTDPPKGAPPEVTDKEQIQILVVQNRELATENEALKAKLARIDKVNQIAVEWNKRGCIVMSNPDGLLACKPPEPKSEASKEQKK